METAKHQIASPISVSDPPPYNGSCSPSYLRVHYTSAESNMEQRMMAYAYNDTWSTFLKRLRAKLNKNNITGLKYLDDSGNYVVIADQEDFDIALLCIGQQAKDPRQGTVVGYILSKKYTEGRIRDYTEGSGSITSSQHYHARQSNRSDKAETEDGKGLRRSVERSL
ncbi:hypothetical protein EC973_001210 [Apophysomyces ossiformis]|uniref:PB1 domain-containing protein n=1 Tax=Apophysomyces ossiformis TaxID=679940 RepID=A0A8H7BK32_9FUNG|nr:hypothetical protein EC973_001210 [Apophysomyces ossiformis]